MTKGYKLLGYKLADNIFYCLHHRKLSRCAGHGRKSSYAAPWPVYWSTCWRTAENVWSAMKS